jgi:hypothetical protein
MNALHARDYRILLWNLQHALPLVLLNRGSCGHPAVEMATVLRKARIPSPWGSISAEN